MPDITGELSPPNDDLRASLEAAFDAPDGGEIVSDTTKASEPDNNTASEDSAAQGDRARDPSTGKFIVKDGEDAPLSDKQVSPSEDTQAKVSEIAPSNAQDAPPAGWTADAKAEWSNLSPAVKAAAIKRENEIAEGGRQWSEQKRQYEHLLSPIVQESSRLGMRPDEALNALLAAHHALNANAPRAIKALADQFGVDLSTLAGQQPAEGSREAHQPNIEALVRQAVSPILAPLQERFAAEDRAKEKSMTDYVNQFAASTGHEHFEAVQADIMDLLPGIKARNSGWTHEKILQEAYDRAVYANPTTRSAVLSAREIEADQKRKTEAKERADKARRAGSSVTGNPSGTQVIAAKDSLRAELEAAFTGS